MCCRNVTGSLVADPTHEDRTLFAIRVAVPGLIPNDVHALLRRLDQLDGLSSSQVQ